VPPGSRSFRPGRWWRPRWHQRTPRAVFFPSIPTISTPTAGLWFLALAGCPDIERVKARMGWEMPWYTLTDGFDTDFGVDEV
jgi:hypothetical protein